MLALLLFTFFSPFKPLRLSFLLWHYQGWEHLYSVLYSFILCQWLGFSSWKSMSSVYLVAVIEVLFIAEARRIWLHFLHCFLVFELVIAFFLACQFFFCVISFISDLYLITAILCIWVLSPWEKVLPVLFIFWLAVTSMCCILLLVLDFASLPLHFGGSVNWTFILSWVTSLF